MFIRIKFNLLLGSALQHSLGFSCGHMDKSTAHPSSTPWLICDCYYPPRWKNLNVHDRSTSTEQLNATIRACSLTDSRTEMKMTLIGYFCCFALTDDLEYPSCITDCSFNKSIHLWLSLLVAQLRSCLWLNWTSCGDSYSTWGWLKLKQLWQAPSQIGTWPTVWCYSWTKKQSCVKVAKIPHPSSDYCITGPHLL